MKGFNTPTPHPPESGGFRPWDSLEKPTVFYVYIVVIFSTLHLQTQLLFNNTKLVNGLCFIGFARF
jgi:hypothetical protein